MVDKFISGSQVLTILNIKPFQLVDLIANGLTPHDELSGSPLRVLSEEQGRLFELKRSLDYLLEPDNIINNSFDKSKQASYQIRLASCRKELAELEAKGVTLPDFKNYLLAPGIILKKSISIYDQLAKALFKESQVLALRGDLPSSCPNHEICQRAFNQQFFSELKGAIERNTANGQAHHKTSQPPFLDTNNKHYSSELAIAFQCWEAMFIQDGYKAGRPFRNQAKNWLKRNHDHLSGEAMERIATLINPNIHKRGGVKKLQD
jgi:hypothetical protein